MKLMIILLSLLFSIQAFTATKKLGVAKGEIAPAILTKDINGVDFSLKESLKSGEVVLVFYRGGWCPYCNLQLRNLQNTALSKVQEKGAKMVVISVDRADESLKTKKQEKLGMTVLSDPDADLIRKYNVAYKVPKDLVAKYKNNYKIDLEKASGKKHHIIAVPAVFVIDQKGRVKFSYVNEDYKTRAQVADIIKALN